MAPFPAPRQRIAPWALTRTPHQPAAYVHQRAEAARIITARTQPPPRAGVANASLMLDSTIPVNGRVAHRRAVPIPAPGHLLTLSFSYVVQDPSDANLYVEIPELGLRFELATLFAFGSHEYARIPLNIDYHQPVTLAVAYEASNPSAAVAAVHLAIQATLPYRPLTP